MVRAYCTPLVAISLGAAILKNTMKDAQNFTNRMTQQSIFWVYAPSKWDKHFFLRELHCYVHCSIIHNRQARKTTRVPVNRWMDKENVVDIYIFTLEYYSTFKIEILPFVTAWMILENYTKLNNPATERKIVHDLSHMCNLIKSQAHRNRVEWWLLGGR